MLTVSLHRSLFKNAISQIGGRVLLSLGRLVVAVLIVRHLGSERFGAYALVVWFLILFEWLVDFGQTDIAVRDICREPERGRAILRALAILKAAQGLALCALLPLTLYALGYPTEIIRAALIGAVGLPAYAAVQVYRARFKVAMCLERDVLAELGGLAVMLPLTWYAAARGGGVEALTACYAVSRIVFLLLAIAFAGRAPAVREAVSAPVVLALLRQAAPLGMAGFLVSLYDGLALLVLSKLADLAAVAQYAAATRYVFPVIIVVQSLVSAFYAPLSAAWLRSPEQLARLQQLALESSLLVAGAIVCAVYGGAVFLMTLLGPSMAGAAGVLRLLCWVVLARGVTTAMAPLIVIAGRQGQALWLTVASVTLQLAALLALVPRFGIVGAAAGYLAVELVLGVVPVSLIGQYVSGVRIRWSAPLRLLAAAAITVGLCGQLPFAGGLGCGVLSVAVFLLLSAASGAVAPRRVYEAARAMLHRQTLAGPPIATPEETEA